MQTLQERYDLLKEVHTALKETIKKEMNYVPALQLKIWRRSAASMNKQLKELKTKIELQNKVPETQVHNRILNRHQKFIDSKHKTQ